MQNSKFYILILIVIAVISHLAFFDFRNILFFGDWTHWSNGATKELLNFGYGSWINYYGFGGQNIQYFFNIFKFIWGIIGDYDIATKITFFIPISIFGFLAPYFLIQYYTKNNLVSFLIALFYGFNTYFLVRQTAHPPIAFIFTFTPILILFFDRFLHFLKKTDFFIFTLIYFVLLCYEVRVMYIVTIILIIYFLFFGLHQIKNKTLWKYIGLFLFLQLGLNSFWLLPTILSSGDAISSITNRGLFGNNLFNILYSFSVFDLSWSGGIPNQDFIPQKIPPYLWLYPFLIILSTLFISQQNKKRKKMIYFGLTLSVIGILLTKQSSSPFPELYLWLYTNFPGFNLFREASKFYIITVLAYTIILGVFLDTLQKEHKKIFLSIACYIIIVSLLIAKPLITGEIGALFSPKVEPVEYSIVNKYIQEKNTSFKTLSFPIYSQWLSYDMKNPKVSMIQLIDSEYKNFMQTQFKRQNYDDVSTFIFEPLSENILNISGIRYLIVGMNDPQEDIFNVYSSDPEQYYKKLKEFLFLKEIKIQGVSEIKIFENQGYLSTIFLSDSYITKENIDTLTYKNLAYSQKNPSHYILNLNIGEQTKTLNISQKNNPYWGLYIGKFTWRGTIGNKLYSIKHKDSSLDFINSWSLSKDEIIKEVNAIYGTELKKEGYPKSLNNKRTDYKYYIKNPDGSIDVELSLYFKPQSYFYLGLIISGISLIILIGYLCLGGLRKKRKKYLKSNIKGNKLS